MANSSNPMLNDPLMRLASDPLFNIGLGLLQGSAPAQGNADPFGGAASGLQQAMRARASVLGPMMEQKQRQEQFAIQQAARQQAAEERFQKQQQLEQERFTRNQQAQLGTEQRAETRYGKKVKAEAKERRAFEQFKAGLKSKAEDNGLPKSMAGFVADTLFETRKAREVGEQLTPDQVMREQFAIAEYTQPQFKRLPDGSEVVIRPELPVGFGPQSQGAAPGTGEVVGVGEAPGAPRAEFSVEQIQPSEVEGAIVKAEETFENIGKLIEQAVSEGVDVSGLAASISAGPVGGFAKQIEEATGAEGLFGSTVGSTLPGAVKRQVDILKSQLAPILLEKGKLGEAERKRLDQIVGRLDASTSADDFGQALNDMQNFVQSMKKR